MVDAAHFSQANQGRQIQEAVGARGGAPRGQEPEVLAAYAFPASRSRNRAARSGRSQTGLKGAEPHS